MRSSRAAPLFTQGRASATLGAVLVPILDVETSDLLGGIYLSRRWDTRAMARLLPAVQSLAAQIASALHRAQVYENEQRTAASGRNDSARWNRRSPPSATAWRAICTTR